MPTSRNLSENDYGDHKDTAKAIAEQIGLKHTAKVLEGIDLDLMSEEELIRQVPKSTSLLERHQNTNCES